MLQGIHLPQLGEEKNLLAPTLAFSSGELVNTELLNSNRLIVSIPIAAGNSGGPVIGKYGLVRGQITSGSNLRWNKEAKVR